MPFWAASGLRSPWRGLAAVPRADGVGLHAEFEFCRFVGAGRKTNRKTCCGVHRWSAKVTPVQLSPAVACLSVPCVGPNRSKTARRSSRNTTCCAIPRRTANDCGTRWLPPGPWLRTDFRSGPGGGYAAPTPTTDGKLVYVVFGSSVIAALDFDGRVVWRKEITPYTFDVTIGSSPVLFHDTLLMLCAMANKSDSKLVAYDKADGSIRWETPLPETGFGHSTPVLIKPAADRN